MPALANSHAALALAMNPEDYWSPSVQQSRAGALVEQVCFCKPITDSFFLVIRRTTGAPTCSRPGQGLGRTGVPEKTLAQMERPSGMRDMLSWVHFRAGFRYVCGSLCVGLITDCCSLAVNIHVSSGMSKHASKAVSGVTNL